MEFGVAGQLGILLLLGSCIGSCDKECIYVIDTTCQYWYFMTDDLSIVKKLLRWLWYAFCDMKHFPRLAVGLSLHFLFKCTRCVVFFFIKIF